ncbi:alpha/beta fold hydrolase [Ferruginivarius sediminum]|nr:alpha/beta fold hydrolase [Ferruginivarius sediminum]
MSSAFKGNGNAMTTHAVTDFELQSGDRLHEARLAYKTYGKLNRNRDNLILFPTYYTGRITSNEPYFGEGRTLDPRDFCIVVPCLIGNGDSSSPSNALGAQAGASFPNVTVHDNVRLQRDLLEKVFGVEKIALVIGWSMGGCQAYEWAVQHPDMVERVLPFCATAKCSAHNFVFLEGVKAALTADRTWNRGAYLEPPVNGLKAFGRVYAGWAYSQAFFRDETYRQLGHDSIEDLLAAWERDHLEWDANDLLCKLWTWQHADVSANARFQGDFRLAMQSIQAKSLVMPSSSDLYFTNEDSRYEAALIPGAEFRPFESTWGHCAATPSAAAPDFMGFLDKAIADLLNR